MGCFSRGGCGATRHGEREQHAPSECPHRCVRRLTCATAWKSLQIPNMYMCTCMCTAVSTVVD
eukprot:2403817-Prymnesium_polylepis.1